jgi:putative salt-induced outer membrane protein YdiY
MKYLSTIVSAASIVSAAGLCAAEVLEYRPAVLDLNEAAAAQPEADAPPAEVPESATILEGWSGSAELGLNGSSGNTDTLNIRGALKAGWKKGLWDVKAAMTYTRSESDNETTENRFVAEARGDRLFSKDSKWRFFGQGEYVYDDFKDWQHRIALGAGVGYAFIQNDKTFLLGRAGLGTYREMGGTDEDWHFEAILGADFSHKFTDRQKISGMVEIYPSLDDGGEFRTKERLEYEVLVDPEVKMSFKAGIEHEHDSDPGPGTDEDDVRYYALLVWSF